jgi:NAD+ synthase (glutamine-hydrolysing)
VAALAAQGVDLFVNLSASPYEFGKTLKRLGIFQRHVARHHRPFVFVNRSEEMTIWFSMAIAS